MIIKNTKRKKYFNFNKLTILILIYFLIFCVQQGNCRYRYRQEPMPDTGIVEEPPELLLRFKRLASSFLNYLNGS
uniref:Candidate secreted effector n=1 Tax=Meloidogyne incognita TaxID=6306 RepID=A0A914LIP0_MELIC